MLFNSYEFIFAFLPVTVAGFYLLGWRSRMLSLHWLILASLFFYAWWRPLNVLIIAPSILVNFALARGLQRLTRDDKRRGAAQAVLIAGIAFNVAFLGYFKYTYFLGTAINDAFGANLGLAHIVLPLGISFITFQKIAFLIDVHSRRIETFTARDYCLFVLFFPQLIAGPIVHYREMMPQFQQVSGRLNRDDVAVGLTLFLFGLFKKSVIADGISPSVALIYDQAASGTGVSFLFAWIAGVGFLLQLYFDFSGYTDMALGAARLIGIRLPPNFNSPLRAPSIIDFWLRWHMTLTRFLTAYIYNPLVLALTRRRLAKGLKGFGGRDTTPGAFALLLMFPTLLTMFVSGLWHGAGYLFVLWGLLHGVYLTVNHAWRLIAPRLWPDRAAYARLMKPAGITLTFLCVAVSMVLFRSPTVGAAVNLLKGMMGLNGIALPVAVYERVGPLAGWLERFGVMHQAWGGQEFVKMAIAIPILIVVVMACPNTLQMLARHEPAIGVRQPAESFLGRALEWRPSLAWAAGISALAVIGVLFLGGESEFLYWQF
ncbi:MAG TPA: MBOAT family O-acyltransferase [Burkholderiales bacterium]|nr:MBOAT family O-acyltransferase [Burkholderiales bacterium]